jgi:biopolymer transport protein ExbD
MRAVVAALVIVCGCFMQSPVMTFGGGKSAQQAQYDRANQLNPPVLVSLDDGWAGDVAVAKVRVWADDDFRSQNLRWQQTFAEQLQYANEVLAPMLGVRLEAEYREWNHHLPAGSTLSEKLDALGKQDPGTDVMHVIGLTSALSIVSATFDQLGIASLPGRHLVVRGYADVFERQIFDRVFRELTPEQRDSLYRARRRHKTTAVLLHELGHNLGAGHEELPDTIMNAQYSDKSASFTPQARDAMLATVDARLSRKHVVRKTAPADTHPTLIIKLDAAGERFIGGNAIDDSTLDDLLRMSFADDRDTNVVVKAARGTPKQAVIKVLDRAKAAGLQRLAVATDDSP